MQDACYIVCNKNGQALGYFYFEDDRGRRVAAKPARREEFVSGSKSAIQRIEEARLKGVWSPAQRRLSQ
jgi:hypothetical protein